MRKLAIVAVGALPIAGIAVASHFLPDSGDNAAVRLAACTALGALWGFAVGLLRRSLMRTIIGLNVGALCGYLFFYLGISDDNAHELRAISALLLSGALLGCALNFRRESLGAGVRGFLAGALAFGFMGCAAWSVGRILEPNVVGWTVMSVVPFGGGMAIFIALVGKEPAAASIATAASADRLSHHDYARGRSAEPLAGAANSSTDPHAHSAAGDA